MGVATVSGFVSDRYAGDALEVGEDVYVSPRCGEELLDGGRLTVTYLHGQQPFAEKRGVSLGDEPAVDVEAFGAAEEGEGGLVVADLGVEVCRQRYLQTCR